ncbi:cytidylate kinase [Eubacterium uniforme]|uniref:Cytidylate kinase n=1 Tax=Eubacterium uniforme TaxID=39495 RepID=A0A1T4V5J1_9FIRM|nr:MULTISPECIES: cytidylate kinase-like family protein [Eubacterium]MCR5628336.1 cytidylate kinase-like family protein [Eubacterium sp.]SKA60250.1 cytidylate kinase [Eubacterium uniforme]
MNGNLIITIGRETGSGGREIGKMLADKLGISYYNKELLTEAARQSGLSEDILETNDERPTNSLLYSIVMDTYSFGYATSSTMDMPINNKVFLAQFNAIKTIAAKGPCVIVGRCADYALAGNEDCVSIFITADMKFRTRRISTENNLTVEKAKAFIKKTDKKRSSYYNFYTEKKWGEASSYDLCVCSSRYGIEKTVEIILNYLKTIGKIDIDV